MFHTKFGLDRFCRFDVLDWTQTDKQTDRQAKYIYIEDFLNDNIHAWTGYEMALFKPLVNQQLGNLLWILIVFLGGGVAFFRSLRNKRKMIIKIHSLFLQEKEKAEEEGSC